MTEHRDTLVGDALRRLDVPEHEPDFWARLEARLDAAPGSDPVHGVDADHQAADVIELGAGRQGRATRSVRSRRAPAVAVAAAAAIALAVGLGLPAVQQAADGDAQVDLAERTPDPAPDATGPTPRPDPATTTTIASPEVLDVTPAEVATDWLTALRDGDVDSAYALLDETSQAALPLETFRELATGLAEGAGAFATLDSTTVPLLDDEGLAATAVVFTGDVQREGMIETASHPVVVTGDPEDPDRTLRVAFVLDGPRVEAEQRTNPSDTRTSPLEVDLSPTAGASWAVFDGVTLERIDTGSATVVVDVEAAAGPGTHTVVVVSTEAGRYTARSYTVVVP